MRVALLGLGLIGGSIAQALARHGSEDGEGGAWSVRAWSPGGSGPRDAARDAIAEANDHPEDAIRDADLVVLAAPPAACLAMLDDLAGTWRSSIAPGAVITDVASTKAAIVVRATALGLPFVGGHPMAGRETSGYGAADPDLFVDRPWIIVPGGAEDLIGRVEALALACGARPIRMAATAHDQAVAGISHLPLVVAASLVEAVLGSDGGPEPRRDAAAALAAGGWRDATRVARGDVAMGVGIMTTNAGAVAARIRDLQAVLDAWLTDLEAEGGPDTDAIEARLRGARARLEAMA
jgi:prephenate dehydrogenase